MPGQVYLSGINLLVYARSKIRKMIPEEYRV